MCYLESRVHRVSARLTMLAVLAAGWLVTTVAGAATYVIPHWIEHSGSTAGSTYVFDDFIYLRYTPGLVGTSTGPGAIVDLYLYDNSAGSPLAIFGTEVCNPCTFNIGGASPRNITAEIGEIIASRTTFATPVYVGYAIVAVGGADPGGVSIENDLVNSHSGPFDLAVTSFPPPRLRYEDPTFPGARVFTIPHMLDTPGSTATSTYTFDETLFAVYTGGQAGATGGAGAIVSLYLFDESSGAPLTNNGLVVCGPCAYSIGGSSPRKLTIRMEDLITAKGGSFDAAAKRATGVVVLGGADPGHVTLQPWLINAHSNAFDLATAAQVAEPVAASGFAAVTTEDHPGLVRALTVSPNPAASAVRLEFDLASAGVVDLSILDVAGREVARVSHGSWTAGPHELRWDGRDASGRPVEGGIYFARLKGPDHSTVSRVVMLH